MYGKMQESGLPEKSFLGVPDSSAVKKKKKKRKENPTANAGRHQGCEFNPWGQVDPLEKGMKHFL